VHQKELVAAMSGDPFPDSPQSLDSLSKDPSSAILAAALAVESLAAMNGETLERRVTITNPQGFHMRPATAFAQLASQFQSSVWVTRGDRRINGKSPLELMFLGADQGSELILEVTGSDASAALEALAELLAKPSLDDAPETPLPPKG
jgi:phosphotransferase system HPr (HPr) family protein